VNDFSRYAHPAQFAPSDGMFGQTAFELANIA
jgi:hypothetical protein